MKHFAFLRRFAFLSRFAVTGLALVAALLVGRQIWSFYIDAPWTRDGRVRADVVTVAPDVSGLVTEVVIHDEQNVHRGDLLFRIDPVRFKIALQQSDAVVAARKATLDQSVRDFNRYRRLDTLSTSVEKQESVKAAMELATANYRQALSDHALAELNLARSEVKAPVSGTVTNVDLRPGTYVSAGKGIFALIDSDTVRVEGYFEETKLASMAVGDKVRVTLMGVPGVLRGHVQSVAAGVADRERSASTDMLVNVNPTFSWVRLAQRVPVRVAIDAPPEGFTEMVGRTATVTVTNDSLRAPSGLLGDAISMRGVRQLFDIFAPAAEPQTRLAQDTRRRAL
jgi:multidrug resistance efflux pump